LILSHIGDGDSGEMADGGYSTGSPALRRPSA